MKRTTCGSIGCYFSSPKNFWTPLRWTAFTATCLEAGAVGLAVAGPLGAGVVAGAFDISAEHAKHKIDNLGN